MIELKSVYKSYDEKSILRNLSLKVNSGEFVCITGKSGSGKTTLLHILSLLEEVDEGEVIVNGVGELSKKAIQKLRRQTIGNLFQNYALIENGTVLENLKVGIKYHKKKYTKDDFESALKKVGLENIALNQNVYSLSGGEQQRVALARLILQDCDYIFADEPTGNLDCENRDLIFNILKQLNQEGKAVVLVTHDDELVTRCPFIVKL